MALNREKIYVALSGGVDSAVAAALLVQAGHDVSGVYMKNWSSSEGLSTECTHLSDRRDAARVAAHLDIPFEVVDFEEEYRSNVYRYFVDSYRKGLTPNPDVVCNSEIKFGILLDWVRAKGVDKLATGHYAKVSRDSSVFHLLRGVDKLKDQSYFLHRLTQGQLGAALFPLGKLTKPEVRQLAQKFKLPNAKKKDSQGLCFVGKVDLKEFLQQEIPARVGPVLDEGGAQVGEHSGAAFYTIGQRHGLRVAQGSPQYIVASNVATNTVVLGSDEKLERQEIKVSDIHWITKPPKLPTSLQIQIRYRTQPVPAVLKLDGILNLGKPVRAVAPGQFVVFLQGEEVLGGGVITAGQ
jgi:tRNA-specific 2-thiouridylase